MKLEKTFSSLEEMAQFLRENGYYVSRTRPVEYVPVQPFYPVNIPTYPYPPITVGTPTPTTNNPTIQC